MTSWMKGIGMNGIEIQLPNGCIATDYTLQNARNHALNIKRMTNSKNASTPIIKGAKPASLESLMGSPKTPEKQRRSVPGSPRRDRASIPQCDLSGSPRRIYDHPYQYPYFWSPSNRAPLQYNGPGSPRRRKDTSMPQYDGPGSSRQYRSIPQYDGSGSPRPGRTSVTYKPSTTKSRKRVAVDDSSSGSASAEVLVPATPERKQKRAKISASSGEISLLAANGSSGIIKNSFTGVPKPSKTASQSFLRQFNSAASLGYLDAALSAFAAAGGNARDSNTEAGEGNEHDGQGEDSGNHAHDEEVGDEDFYFNATADDASESDYVPFSHNYRLVVMRNAARDDSIAAFVAISDAEKPGFIANLQVIAPFPLVDFPNEVENVNDFLEGNPDRDNGKSFKVYHRIKQYWFMGSLLGTYLNQTMSHLSGKPLSGADSVADANFIIRF